MFFRNDLNKLTTLKKILKCQILNSVPLLDFLTKQGKSVENILIEMGAVYGKFCSGKTMVYKWNKLCKQSRELLEDDERPGRPNDVTTHEIVMKVEIAVMENGQLKLKELAKMFKSSETTVYKILHRHLNMSKVSARWVPRMLLLFKNNIELNVAKSF